MRTVRPPTMVDRSRRWASFHHGLVGELAALGVLVLAMLSSVLAILPLR